MTFAHPTIKSIRMTSRPGPEGGHHKVLQVETDMDMPYSRSRGANRHESFRDLMIQIAKLKTAADSRYAEFDSIEVKGPTWSAFANSQTAASGTVSHL